MWHYLMDGESQGPVPIQELVALLSQRKIKGDTLVWSEGMAEWTPLIDTDVMDQFDALVADPQPVSAPVEEKSRIAAHDLKDELAVAKTPQGEMVPDELLGSVLSGAHWFYWIAALTFINLILMAVHSPLSMALGLAGTDIAYALLSGKTPDGELAPISFPVVMIYLIPSLLLVFFGRMASKGNRLLFIWGAALVALDSLLFIFPMFSIIALVVHGYAIFSMTGGILALGKIRQIEGVKAGVPDTSPG